MKYVNLTTGATSNFPNGVDPETITLPKEWFEGLLRKRNGVVTKDGRTNTSYLNYLLGYIDSIAHLVNDNNK